MDNLGELIQGTKQEGSVNNGLLSLPVKVYCIVFGLNGFVIQNEFIG